MTIQLQIDHDVQRYKKLKELFNIEFNGYNLKSLIAYDIARVCFNKKIPRIKSFTRFFTIPSIKRFRKIVSKDCYLFSKVYSERKDYEELLKSICDEISAPIEYINFKNSFRIVIRLKNILSSFAEAKKVSNQLKITEFIFYWASLCYYKNYLSALDKNITPHIKIKAFVAHNSSLTPYNIWVLFFKKNGTPTYSIQHGVYVKYLNKANFALISYENITADYMLCWGRHTIEVINQLKNKSCNLLLAGNPKYKSLSLRKMKQTFTSCIVFLGRQIYEEGNLLLLNLISEYSKKFNIPFHIKPHPALTERKYKKVSKQLGLIYLGKGILLSDLLNSNNYDFAISYNSTTYYETMPYGIPSLRFSMYENEDLYGLDDKFSSINELNNVIKSLKLKDNQEFNREVEYVLNYVFGINNVRYGEIFQ